MFHKRAVAVPVITMDSVIVSCPTFKYTKLSYNIIKNASEMRKSMKHSTMIIFVDSANGRHIIRLTIDGKNVG